MFKKKYMLIVGGLLLFTCLTAVILSVTLNYMKSSRKWALRELEEQVNAGSKQLKFYVKGMSSYLIRIEKYLANNNMKVDKELYGYLNFARNHHQDAISEILILDAIGNVVADTNPASLQSSFRESEYFKNTQHTFNKIYLSKAIIVSDLNARPEVSPKIFHDPLDMGWVLYTGVYSKGVFKGAVLFVLRSEPFFNRYSMALSKLASGYGFILQKDGRILFHRNVELRGKFLSDLPDSEYMARARELLKKTEENGFRHRVTGQHIMLTSDIYLPNQIWTLGIFTTKSKLAQKTINFIYTLTGLVLLLGTVIFGLVFALIRLGQARDALRRNEDKLIIRNQIAGIFLTAPDDQMYGGVLEIVLEGIKSKFGVFGYINQEGALVCPSMTKDIWDKCQMIDKDIIFLEDTWKDSIWGNGLRTKKSAYANHPFKVPEGHIPVDRCLTVPLVYQNKSIGVLTVANKPTDYTDSDKQTLEEIAEYVAPVLHARIERIHTEDILHESKKRFKDVINSINDLIMLLDPDFRIQLVNSATAKAFNIPINEFTGKYCYKLLYGRNDICEGCPMIKALNSEEVTNALRYRPNGQIWDRMVYPVFDDTGNITGATVIGSDITKTKRSEEALRKSEEKYRTLLETTSEGCWMLNPENKTIEVNESLCKMLGYSQDEMLGKTPFDFVDDENRKIFIEQTSKISTTPHRSYEITLKKKNGQGLHTYFNATTIRDESDEVQGSFAFVTDITEIKQAEEERNRLVVAIEQAAESVFITDRNGTIQYVNPTFERLTGYSRKDAIGQNPRILKSGKQDAFFYKRMWDTLIRGISWKGRVINRKKDGSFYEADATISPIFDKSGKITNFVSIKRDVTREIELEKRLIQAQKMESIGTLAGGIAHDFNNILFSVSGYTELALDDTERGTPLHDNLQEVFSAAKRASDLVKQILAFSRQADQELKPLNVHLVVIEALKLIRSSLPSTIEINQNISNTCGLVMADATQIHQVAMNLLTNAYHAMEDEGGKLDITLKEVDLDADDLKDPAMVSGSYVCLTVEDTGIGIDKSVIDRIFEPYFSTKGKDKGTGLGLAMVHGIVKSYGGDIRIYSEPGKGTAFHVYLPVIQPQAETKEIQIISPVEKGKERILLVDDEEQIVRMEQQMLEKLGYHITTRTSSIETLEAFRAAPDKFDLVITDMTMPNMTGIHLAKKLMEIRSDIPIIIFTGFSEKISEDRAKAMGIRGYVMKPVVKSELAKKIRQVLDQS